MTYKEVAKMMKTAYMDNMGNYAPPQVLYTKSQQRPPSKPINGPKLVGNAVINTITGAKNTANNIRESAKQIKFTDVLEAFFRSAQSSMMHDGYQVPLRDPYYKDEPAKNKQNNIK